jgi:NADH:ubiquinone oxidoreductase subunit F (NADH-binding)
VKSGLWDKPTVLNNVETWANVPSIILKGSRWFASKGTKSSKGTKILALTGQVKNTGLVEVAMGTSLRTIVFDIGGGSKTGNAVKAVQTGGPSGGCLPVGKFDLPIDFDLERGRQPRHHQTLRGVRDGPLRRTGAKPAGGRSARVAVHEAINP